MAYLINGNGYKPVTAQQDADLYAGIVGLNLQVLNVGQKMAATLVDSNTVRIGDGEALVQGRRIHNDPGMYDDFIIPNGSQGTTHWYIIGYLLHTDSSTGQEVADTFVQQMSSATATITEDVLRDGAAQAYISMYRITQTNVSLTKVEPLYDETYSLRNMIDVIYPVGSIYMGVNPVNPGTWIQNTTWVAWASGRVPVGVNTSDGNFNTVEKTGGSKTQTLTVANLPAHNHDTRIPFNMGVILGAKQGTGQVLDPVAGWDGTFGEMRSSNTGSGTAHNNLQPYITCYFWKRTA